MISYAADLELQTLFLLIPVHMTYTTAWASLDKS